MNPVRHQATCEDLLKVPDILIAEIIDGELIISPRPAIPYSHASGAVIGELSPFDRGFGEARSRGTLVCNCFWPDRVPRASNILAAFILEKISFV